MCRVACSIAHINAGAAGGRGGGAATVKIGVTLHLATVDAGSNLTKWKNSCSYQVAAVCDIPPWG